MSESVEILAMGPFSDTVRTLMNAYGTADDYHDTTNGTLVMACLFDCEFTSAARELADILGADHRRPASLHLTTDQINWIGLETFARHRQREAQLHALHTFLEQQFTVLLRKR